MSSEQKATSIDDLIDPNKFEAEWDSGFKYDQWFDTNYRKFLRKPEVSQAVRLASAQILQKKGYSAAEIAEHVTGAIDHAEAETQYGTREQFIALASNIGGQMSEESVRDIGKRVAAPFGELLHKIRTRHHLDDQFLNENPFAINLIWYLEAKKSEQVIPQSIALGLYAPSTQEVPSGAQ